MSISASKAAGLVLAVVVAAAVLFLWPRREVSAEDLIRQRVIVMTRLAEEKQLGELMDNVSDRFRGRESTDKSQIKGYLAAQMFRGEWLRIFMTDLDVTLTSPTTADVTARFIFARSEAKELSNVAKESVMSAYLVEMKFEKEADDAWRVIRGTHRALEPGSLF